MCLRKNRVNSEAYSISYDYLIFVKLFDIACKLDMLGCPVCYVRQYALQPCHPCACTSIHKYLTNSPEFY